MKIENGRYWDLPLSLVDGCTPCSPGCDHCWSASMAHRFRGDAIGVTELWTGKFNGKILTHPERLDIPLKRRKPTVYAVWNDIFHEDVPFDFIGEALATASIRSQHTFLVLTKRPTRILDLYKYWENKYPPFKMGNGGFDADNIYLGLTVCSQQEADEKAPVFLRVPGKKFLSIEPCLSNISLWEEYLNIKWVEYFDVVIMGAETGAGARPMDLEWARTIRDECEVAGTPFFLKQVDKKRNRLLDGATYDQLPWCHYEK
jgi:protein gp37